MNSASILLIFLQAIGPLCQVYGQSLVAESVFKTLPDSSKKWLPWIMADKEYLKCPYSGVTSTYECAWFSPLHLNLTSSGGSFNLKVETFSETHVILPGSSKNWPLNVTSNGSPLAVTTHNGYPSVILGPGINQLLGNFLWKALPESLRVPTKIALTRLNINDISIQNPKLGSDGELWLGQTILDDSHNKDSVNLSIYRLYDDSIPSMLKTRMVLEIGGKAREISLGPILPNGFNVLSLQSLLPVQWTPDGKVRIRAYAGKHEVEVVGRSLQRHDQLSVPIIDDPIWPKKELWAIKQDLHHRELAIDLLSIDPSQTTFPDDWKNNSLYSLDQGNQIEFNPKDPIQAINSSLDQLKIHREIWLDSSGKGFSVRDNISGDLQNSWRIDAAEGYKLGKAYVNNQNILISKNNSNDGVEIRDSNIEMIAEGRIDNINRPISASGWQNDFDRVSVDLHMPPGWKLITVKGSDKISKSWMNQWNLMNIFVLCLITLSTAKILGVIPGILAFITLAFLIPEIESPRWIWLVLVTMVALHRVFPRAGKWRKILISAEFAITFLFIFILINFSIDHLRFGLHPILESPNNSTADYIDHSFLATTQPTNMENDAETRGSKNSIEQDIPMESQGEKVPKIPMPAPTAPIQLDKKQPKTAEEMLSKSQIGAQAVSPNKASFSIQYQNLHGTQQDNRIEIYSSKAAIQTGYGIPNRSWNKVTLNWDGPVSLKHKISFLVIPPLIHGLLSFIRVILACVLGYIIIKRGFFGSADIFSKKTYYA